MRCGATRGDDHSPSFLKYGVRPVGWQNRLALFTTLAYPIFPSLDASFYINMAVITRPSIDVDVKTAIKSYTEEIAGSPERTPQATNTITDLLKLRATEEGCGEPIIGYRPRAPTVLTTPQER